jgi:subtilisin family serine protease
VALKIADSERGGFVGFVQSAIYAARAQGVQIINLSFLDAGHPKRNGRKIDPPWLWPDTRLSQDLRQIAAENGVLCVVAAGNSGKHGEGTMGKYTGSEESLAVGACDCNGLHCEWSSMGPFYVSERAITKPRTLGRRDEKSVKIPCIKPDFVVPGASMVVPVPRQSRHARDAKENPAYFGGQYGPAFGTSVAAAITSGLAACALEKLRAGPRKPGDNVNIGRLLRRILRAAAAEESRSDHHRYGAGILLWPTIDRLIDRFHTEYPFYSRMLSADEPSLIP